MQQFLPALLEVEEAEAVDDADDGVVQTLLPPRGAKVSVLQNRIYLLKNSKLIFGQIKIKYRDCTENLQKLEDSKSSLIIVLTA